MVIITYQWLILCINLKQNASFEFYPMAKSISPCDLTFSTKYSIEYKGKVIDKIMPDTYNISLSPLRSELDVSVHIYVCVYV